MKEYKVLNTTWSHATSQLNKYAKLEWELFEAVSKSSMSCALILERDIAEED